jgi:hypothetical protein
VAEGEAEAVSERYATMNRSSGLLIGSGMKMAVAVSSMIRRSKKRERRFR